MKLSGSLTFPLLGCIGVEGVVPDPCANMLAKVQVFQVLVSVCKCKKLELEDFSFSCSKSLDITSLGSLYYGNRSQWFSILFQTNSFFVPSL